MNKELKKLEDELHKARQINQLLTEENAELRAEVKKLHERMDYLIRQLFGRKSEKIDPNQLMLALGLDELQQEDEPEEDETPLPASVPSGKKRRQVKDRLPEDLPVKITYIDPLEVTAEPDKYRCIGEESHSELSMTHPVYFVNKTVRRKYVRKDDRTQPPVISPAEPRLIENSFASVELLTDIVLKKYTEHLPLYRQEQTLKRRYGIELSRKTMSGWIWHIGNWLQIIYNEIKEEIRSSGYLQVDETCIKYLVPGTGRAHSGYLWVYYTPGGGVILEWHTGRGSECLNSMLGSFFGDIQCDGYQAYRTFNLSRDEEARCQIYACWAHVRRKFFNAQNESTVAAEILREIQNLYRIESELRKNNATHKQRAVRRRESKAILDDIKVLLDNALADHRPQSLTGKAVTYTLNLWNELIRYAETGHVEIDNNLVENAIRPTAIGKKNWLFFGSPDSGQQSAIIFSVLETCRKLGVDQYAYLHDVLSRLPKLTAQEAKQLTPARWQKKHAVSAA
jgi:transposase